MFRPLCLNAHNPGPLTGGGNNTYLLIARDGPAALIDAGVGEPRHLAAIDNELQEEHARLERVFVTHGHPDHAAGAPAIAAAHEGIKFEKYPWPERDETYAVPWHPLNDGERVLAGGEPLTILHTPGHSPDHLAFWHEPSGTIFSGDLVVAGSSVAISWRSGGRLEQYLSSLERLLSLAPARLLPAHGKEIANPAALLQAAIDHRRQREQQVADALAAGRETVSSIAESIYDGLGPDLMPMARETVRAHLEKLRNEGRAFEDGGRWWTNG